MAEVEFPNVDLQVYIAKWITHFIHPFSSALKFMVEGGLKHIPHLKGEGHGTPCTSH